MLSTKEQERRNELIATTQSAQTAQEVHTVGVALVLMRALEQLESHCQSEIVLDDDKVAIDVCLYGIKRYNFTITIDRDDELLDNLRIVDIDSEPSRNG